MRTFGYYISILIYVLCDCACLVAGSGGSKLLTDPDGLASQVASGVSARMADLEEGLVAGDSHFEGAVPPPATNSVANESNFPGGLTTPAASQMDADESEEEAEDREAGRAHDAWLSGEIPLSPTSSQPTQESCSVSNHGGQGHLNFIAQIPNQADLKLQKIMLRSQAILANGTQQEKDLLKGALLEELSRLLSAAKMSEVILKDGTKLPPVMAVNQDLIDFAYLLLELGIHEGLQVFDHTYMNIERLRKLMSFQGRIQQAYFQLKVRDYFEKYSTERFDLLNVLSSDVNQESLVDDLYQIWKNKTAFELDPKKPAHQRIKNLLNKTSSPILMKLFYQEAHEFVQTNPGQIIDIAELMIKYPQYNPHTDKLLKDYLKSNPNLPWYSHLKLIVLREGINPEIMLSEMPSMIQDPRFHNRNGLLSLFHRCFVSQDDRMFLFITNIKKLLLQAGNPYLVAGTDWIQMIEMGPEEKVDRNRDLVLEILNFVIRDRIVVLMYRHRISFILDKYKVGASPEQLRRIESLIWDIWSR